jgi:hypothetical protein
VFGLIKILEDEFLGVQATLLFCFCVSFVATSLLFVALFIATMVDLESPLWGIIIEILL